MSDIFDDQPLGQLAVKSNGTIGQLNTTTADPLNGTFTSAQLSVVHKQIGTSVKSIFTLTELPQTVVNGVEYQGSKLFTFPKGVIQFRAAEIALKQKTTSAIATTLNSTTGAVGVGTTTAVSTTLATTTQNLVPTTAFTSSATINIAGAITSAILGTGVVGDFFVLDGTTTAKELYLNSAYATTGDVDGDATQTWTGTIEVWWDLLSWPMSAFNG